MEFIFRHLRAFAAFDAAASGIACCIKCSALYKAIKLVILGYVSWQDSALVKLMQGCQV